MLIESKQNVHNTDLNVNIAGSSVVKVNCVKCLGVIIDESLSWGPHVEYVKKTVYSKLGMLNRIRTITCLNSFKRELRKTFVPISVHA